MGKLKIFKHKKGTMFFFKRRRINKGVFVNFVFNAGRFNDGKFPGRAHLSEHCLSANSDKLSKIEAFKFYDEFLVCNKSTSNNLIEMFGVCSRKQIDHIFDVFSSFVSGGKLSEKDFNEIREVVIQEILTVRKFSKADYFNLIRVFYKPTTAALFKEHTDPRKEIEAISISNVKKYIKNFFTLSEMSVEVTGNISFFRVKRLFKKYFEKRLPEKTNVKRITFPRLPVEKKPSLRYREFDKNGEIYVNFLFPIPQPKRGLSSVFISRFVCREVNMLITEIFREKYGLIYAGNSSLSSLNVSLYYLSIEVLCTDKNVKKVFEIFPEVYERILKSSFSDKVVGKEKQLTKMRKDASIPSALRNFRGITESYDKYGKTFSFWQKIKDKRKFNKLSAAEINKYIINSFTPNPYVTVIGKLEKNEMPPSHAKFVKKLQEIYEKYSVQKPAE